MINIVLGLNYGDEGKGRVVSSLINNETSFIIRFSGGHQVGHTVNYNGMSHIFSNFGSGTLKGIPTYWSKFCTIHPRGILNEYYAIMTLFNIEPILYIDENCPITTPFDIYGNQEREKINKHGSVGVGFGTTVERHKKIPLTPKIVFNNNIVDVLRNIAEYYGITDSNYIDDEIYNFIDEILELIDIKTIIFRKPNYFSKNIIFEGSQGILLDQFFGSFPNVTRSFTTSYNVFKLIKDLNLNYTNGIKFNYVTRSYLTKHGNGKLLFEKEFPNYIKETTNIYNRWQGNFRYAPLNIDLLKYSLDCENIIHRMNNEYIDYIEKDIHISCVDQTGEVTEVINNNKSEMINLKELSNILKIKNINLSYNP